MFKRLNISTKITLLVVAIVIISVLPISLVSYYQSKNSIEARYLETIRALAIVKKQKIEAYVTQMEASLDFGRRIPTVANFLIAEQKQNPLLLVEDESNGISLDSLEQNVSYPKSSESINTTLENISITIEEAFEINQIYLLANDGKIIYKAKGREGISRRVGERIERIDLSLIDDDQIYFSEVYIGGNLEDNKTKDYYFLAYCRVTDEDDKPIGVLVYEVDMIYINKLIRDAAGLGETGEITLVRNYENQVRYLNRLDGKTKGEKIVIDALEVVEVGGYAEKAVSGKAGYRQDVIDYRGEKVLATWEYINELDWGIIVKVDMREVQLPTDRLRWTLIIASLAVIIIAIVIGILFSQLLIGPIFKLLKIIDLLANGELPQKIKLGVSDEIGEMANHLNDLVESLRNTAQFALQIGRGEYDAQFTPKSDNDSLGLALLSMRENIQLSNQRDEERNWIINGKAEIANILSKTTDIERLGEEVIEHVIKKIGAVQGAFYTVNTINPRENEEIFIELNASYAYNKKKYLNGKYKFKEGLIGQAAIEQDTILRTEVPENYVTITSGLLGDKKPSALLIRPLMTVVDRQEQVLGAIEFAGFSNFDQRSVHFVEEVSEIIARTVFNIKVNEETAELLKLSEQNAEELAYNQAVLEQNAEVMEATRKELDRKNKELEQQIEEVQRANDKTRLLLENASEVITIYKENAEITYISPSVEKILGYSMDEMIGLSDITFISDGKSSFRDMFQSLILEPDEKRTIQYRYQTKDGGEIWLEATGTNLLSDPAIQGIVVNSRDITERRRAEEEERKRGAMQALSENSPDLITRISKDDTIFYINPVIEEYTGKNTDFYLQKQLQELEMNEKILNSWVNLLTEVREKDRKVSDEIDFPSKTMGDRIMQVNAIPEYNEQQKQESVLIVSHDVTERKRIELEIAYNNKRIQESINYAKRIQQSIVPDNSELHSYFPESFILYKPRDVVSGDFPWMLRQHDSIYIAAVDCTGHGVPGALISLIGYFLLNNIIDGGASEPGKILDLLDKAVTHTLRQGREDATTRDGMDIALCRIDKNKKQIEYAGAHRPFYMYDTEGNLTETKGDPFPVGGGQYKNRTTFKNKVIDYKPGERFYIFSDGFPDQFGGEQNRKYSPRRIKRFLEENHKLNMPDLYQKMDQNFEDWKGSNKQTDDVLMIGIEL